MFYSFSDHINFVDGDTLAGFEEDARSFLFPEPKLVAPFSGVGREVLMTRAGHFPGIAPRLEFSTKTTITECPHDTEVSIYPKTLRRPVIKRNKGRSNIPRSTSPPLVPLRVGNTQNLTQLSSYSAPYRPSDWETTTSQPVRERSEYDSSYLEAHEPSDWHDGPGPSTLQLSYREPPPHSRRCHRTWEELHERVRGLLTTPKAVRRLVYGATVSEVDEVLARRSISPGPP
uniref:Spermatogenesis-associated protein 6 N-terminal domain-containing protein n=1 Tax=Fundulus heteroclitus TaxID=8078 RepID=A0A3Q2NS97_FUNHE